MLEPEASQKVLAEIPESVNASSDLVVDESTVSFGVNAALTRVKETTEVVKQVISIDKKAPEPTAKAQPRHARTAIIVTMILLIAAGIGLIFLGLVTLESNSGNWRSSSVDRGCHRIVCRFGGGKTP